MRPKAEARPKLSPVGGKGKWLVAEAMVVLGDLSLVANLTDEWINS